MNRLQNFSRELSKIRRRTALIQRADRSERPADPAFDETVEELEVAFEELRVAEEELHAQEREITMINDQMAIERDRYLGLFEFAPDGYLVTDTRGLIIEANRAASTILNVEQKYLIGKPLVSFLEMSSRTTFRCELRALLESDHQEEIELVVEPRNGTSFDCALRVGSIRGADGTPSSLRWIMRDVTARNLAAAEIVRLNEELERKIAERTEELRIANESLEELLAAERRAREEAESAIHSRDRLVAMVSHEIRTPLTPIVAIMEDLDASKIPEEIRMEMEIVRRNSLQAAALINDLLDIARIRNEAMAITLAPTTIDIHGLLREVATSAAPETRAAGLSIELAPEAARHHIEGDPQRLEQVFSNILRNAAKFTPAGGTITIATRNVDEELVIEFIDSGIGIAPEDLSHIFDTFHRVSQASGRQAGLGLGLAICRRIIDLHGGRIEAESAGTGMGTTMRVRLR